MKKSVGQSVTPRYRAMKFLSHPSSGHTLEHLKMSKSVSTFVSRTWVLITSTCFSHIGQSSLRLDLISTMPTPSPARQTRRKRLLPLLMTGHRGLGSFLSEHCCGFWHLDYCQANFRYLELKLNTNPIDKSE